MDALAGLLLLVLIFALVVIWAVRLGKWAGRQVDNERAESESGPRRSPKS